MKWANLNFEQDFRSMIVILPLHLGFHLKCIRKQALPSISSVFYKFEVYSSSRWYYPPMHFLKYGFQTLRIWKMDQILEWQRPPQNLLYAPFKIWNLINLLGATQNLPMVRIKFWWNLKSATGPHNIWKMHEDFEKQHLNQNLVDEPFQNLKSDRLWVAMNVFLKSARLRSRFFMESEMCHCISDLRYFVKICLQNLKSIEASEICSVMFKRLITILFAQKDSIWGSFQKLGNWATIWLFISLLT